ncbi:hypothetical protein [Thysanoplusia orichalcea nucleopolyhedrovirus]|uniref:Uncharacterized protein n=1 Tax=Thysanoplusia orichalcea nucleopolyhedrovirus TaxID=101850 RepID=L0CM41_9ABAC|nr:hypothetical protein [Thysanoplusia orichalcea nucleopolyhedrovirus]AGA16296.1 hypothetical protein [Thysanoplusia orichalcea nucleopolyhedrovirus]
MERYHPYKRAVAAKINSSLFKKSYDNIKIVSCIEATYKNSSSCRQQQHPESKARRKLDFNNMPPFNNSEIVKIIMMKF